MSKRRDPHSELPPGSAAPRMGENDDTMRFDSDLLDKDELGFDYDTFEEELDSDALDEEEADTSHDGDEPDAVAVRKTLDRRLIPKGDATFEIRELGRFMVVTIRGRLNEAFPADTISQQLKGAVIFELSEVDRVSSFGVRGWLRMLQQARLSEAYMVRCSEAIVNQITMMRNFCGPARLHSLVAPYLCQQCGADFGVPYSAIEDRAVIVSRRPYRVQCPECGQPAELDEDPWTYFGVEEHLLDEVSHDLAQTLKHIEAGPRRDPIEKAISGDQTIVRFNIRVTSRTRFARAFAGLEGDVLIDFRTTPAVEAQGAERLVMALNDLDRAVATVVIAGAHDTVVEAVLDANLDLVIIESLTTVVCDPSRGIAREVLVELDRHGPAILEGRDLSIDIPWASGPVQLKDPELAKRAAQRLLQPTQPQEPAPAASPRSGWSRPLALAMVGLAGLSLVSVAAVLAVSVVVGGRAAPEPAAAEAAPVVQVSDEVPDGQWSPGGMLPPAWSENAVLAEDGQLLVVGQASGSSAADAAAASRAAAEAGLAGHVGTLLAASDAGPGLAPFPATHDAVKRFRATSAGAMPLVRVDAATRRDGDTHQVVARYGVAEHAVVQFAQHHGRIAEFRGLTVAAAAPWDPPGVRLVRVESWFRGVAPGDRVLRVGTEPVSDLDAFAGLTSEQWAATPAGAALQITVDHSGDEVSLELRKPSTRVVPDTKPQLMMLEDG